MTAISVLLDNNNKTNAPLLTGCAFYERREDDIELLRDEVVSDHYVIDVGTEFDTAQEVLQELIPTDIGFYVVSFAIEIDYYSTYCPDYGCYEYDANYNVLWHNIRMLEPHEQEHLLKYLNFTETNS